MLEVEQHALNESEQGEITMTSTAVPIVRRSARAVLIDDEARLVTIKRTKPGVAPYWTTPGGGIEPEDVSREAALERELVEELGASAIVGQQLTLLTSPTEGGQSVQYFFAARLISLDAALRTGDEYADASRGGYELERIPLDQLAEYDLKPTKVRDFIVENRAALLADLPPKVL
ncbi:NUDIX hydrolase [Amycolatopsis sp. H20-H5]|uniref:NUDIX hydrolase n=1 Tax=Amycolatopsis sp. H20-H5 TaxID=3046309 RepID=UPI002DB78741|nr:NUDIX domain-containing protein [Amycolatopsis sp. H20-H5]MEC3980845.1 NUDIX domain-containing protein [Amycolatopsis sp. H20-H5]